VIKISAAGRFTDVWASPEPYPRRGDAWQRSSFQHMLAMEFAAVTTQAAQEGKYLRQAGKMKRLLFLLGLLLTQPCLAHDAKRPELDSWYRGLKNPNFNSAVVRGGCCSRRDCHETEADLRDGHWWARVGKAHIEYGEQKPASETEDPLDLVYYDVTWELTDWKEVPPEAVLKTSNPTGSPVICHSTRYEIWCFVPDNQY